MGYLMRIFIIMLIVLGIQTASADSKLKKSEQNGKVGFTNDGGELVIQPQFQEATEFDKNGFSIVRKAGRYGIINTKGEFVIKPEFTKIKNLDENGIAQINQNDVWGLANAKEGTVIVQPKYESIDKFDENGLASISIGYSKNGIINTKGEVILEPKYKEIGKFNKHGLSIIRSGFWYGNGYGIINTKGGVIFEPKMYRIWEFSDNGLALAQSERYGSYGFINTKGYWEFNEKFGDASKFTKNGIAAVKKNTKDGKWGLIDSSGKWVVKPQYDKIVYFDNGLIGVAYNRGTYQSDWNGRKTYYQTWGFMNAQGKIIIEPQFDTRPMCVSDKSTFNLAILIECDRYGGKSTLIVTNKGEKLDVVGDAENKYEGIGTWYNENFIRVRQNDKWGFINPNGEIVIKAEFDKVHNFDEKGFAAVALSNNTSESSKNQEKIKWGFIDTTGKVIASPQFDEVHTFDTNGFASVSKDNKWGFIDMTGKVIVTPQFDRVRKFDKSGFAPVYKGDKWGFVNTTGEIAITPQFCSIDDFDANGLIEVEEECGGDREKIDPKNFSSGNFFSYLVSLLILIALGFVAFKYKAKLIAKIKHQ